MNPDLIKAIDPAKYQRKFLEAGIRADGRPSLTTSRPIEVSRDIIRTALASAACTIGNTRVVVGITAGIFALPDGVVAPAQSGIVKVNSDFSLSILYDRKLAQRTATLFSARMETLMTKIFDMSQLTADVVNQKPDLGISSPETEPRPVWDMHVNVLVVNDDGAVFDAAVIAAIAAIQATRLPPLNEELKIVPNMEPRQLQVKASVVPFSFCQYQDGDESFILDPSRDEENLFPRYYVVANETGEVIFADGPDSTHLEKIIVSPLSVDEALGKSVGLIDPKTRLASISSN